MNFCSEQCWFMLGNYFKRCIHEKGWTFNWEYPTFDCRRARNPHILLVITVSQTLPGPHPNQGLVNRAYFSRRQYYWLSVVAKGVYFRYCSDWNFMFLVVGLGVGYQRAAKSLTSIHTESSVCASFIQVTVLAGIIRKHDGKLREQDGEWRSMSPRKEQC